MAVAPGGEQVREYNMSRLSLSLAAHGCRYQGREIRILFPSRLLLVGREPSAARVDV